MSDQFVRSADQEPPSIPDFELLQVIGQGAYGQVWLARTVTGSTSGAQDRPPVDTFEHDRPFEREYKRGFRSSSRSRARTQANSPSSTSGAMMKPGISIT